MSIDALADNDKVTIAYGCDHSVDGEFDLCDRVVKGTEYFLTRPPSDWWVGMEYGCLRVYCPTHKGGRK